MAGTWWYKRMVKSVGCYYYMKWLCLVMLITKPDVELNMIKLFFWYIWYFIANFIRTSFLYFFYLEYSFQLIENKHNFTIAANIFNFNKKHTFILWVWSYVSCLWDCGPLLSQCLGNDWFSWYKTSYNISTINFILLFCYVQDMTKFTLADFQFDLIEKVGWSLVAYKPWIRSVSLR